MTMGRIWCGLALTALRLTAACPCMIHFGLCDEVQHSDAVFIGTVESVAPQFRDPYSSSGFPAAEIAQLEDQTTPESLSQLKKLYRQMFEGMPDRVLARIDAAGTARELAIAFESTQSEGRYARFRVRTLYKHGDDDDPKPETLDIWTGSGECGIDFQVGESYLVYATEDEDSGKLETSVCMRTRKLSDERGDLGYLYFLQNAPEESARLEGFVSASFSDQNLPRYEDSVSEPSPGAVLELDAAGTRRYTKSDGDGRYSFDGLRAGDYRISLLNAGFPPGPRVVGSSRSFHAEAGSCSRQVLVVPRRQ